MSFNDPDACFQRGKRTLQSALTASPNAIIITHGQFDLHGTDPRIVNRRKHE
jgi:hypothetical protein